MKDSTAVPLPDWYTAAPPELRASSGAPAATTGSLNATVMLIDEPAAYVPSSSAADTFRTVGAAVSISTAGAGPPVREPGAPGSGSVRSASLPARSVTVPPESDVLLAYPSAGTLSPCATA